MVLIQSMVHLSVPLSTRSLGYSHAKFYTSNAAARAAKLGEQMHVNIAHVFNAIPTITGRVAL